MEFYITEISKYLIALLLALYTLECFLAFRQPNEERRNGIYIRQIILMFLFHFSCFLVICFETGELEYLFFYIFQQIFVFAAIVMFHMIYPQGNRLIINNMCMLSCIGFVILTRLSYGKAIRQFFIIIASFIIGMIIPYLIRKFKVLRKFMWLYASVGICALGIVLTLGSVTHGSKISFSVAGVTFQPSEFVKILFVFFIASALYESDNFLRVLLTAVLAGLHVLILVVSKDLGSALIFFIVYALMIYIATGKGIYLFLGAVGGSGAAVVAYNIFSHVRVRVQAWKDPWSCIDDAGFQISQSLFGISSGSWFGLGLFNGNPKSIPFVEEDFVFSALAEELGLIFAICVVLICISCFIMFMNISVKLEDKFYRLIAFGLGITYIFQVFLTIGGGTKFIPMTGVTLPFVSYGGSSVLTTIIMFFIIEGLYIIRQDEGAKSVRKRKRKLKEKSGSGEQPETERSEEEQ